MTIAENIKESLENYLALADHEFKSVGVRENTTSRGYTVEVLLDNKSVTEHKELDDTIEGWAGRMHFNVGTMFEVVTVEGPRANYSSKHKVVIRPVY